MTEFIPQSIPGKSVNPKYLLDKCYPTFEEQSLNISINKYIELYNTKIKNLSKKHPNNVAVFYSDEINSDYGKQKVLSFLGAKS